MQDEALLCATAVCTCIIYGRSASMVVVLVQGLEPGLHHHVCVNLNLVVLSASSSHAWSINKIVGEPRATDDCTTCDAHRPNVEYYGDDMLIAASTTQTSTQIHV